MAEIRNRWTGEVMFGDPDDDRSVRDLVVDAVGRRAVLSGAVLSGAVLSGADLRDAVPRDAVLRDAVLRGAVLRDAYLSGAVLRDADLRGAYLSGAVLRGAVLRGADLRGADLRGAVLSGAVLSGADLSDADLSRWRQDLWDILDHAPHEVPAVRAALVGGRVDGTTYEGSCSCLVGTIATARGDEVGELVRIGIPKDARRPAEQWFMAIRPGDTFEPTPVEGEREGQWRARKAVEWLDSWTESRMRIAEALTGDGDRS